VRPEPPILPNIPLAADVNARDPNNSYNPLVIAASYGSKNATEFLLNSGVDRAAIPVALEKAKQFDHPVIIQLLTAHL
jgi:hypothetical protein